MQPHNAIPPQSLTDKQRYDLLLSEYLDLLDEQTGNNFTYRELSAHTMELSYKQLRQRYTDLLLGKVNM